MRNKYTIFYNKLVVKIVILVFLLCLLANNTLIIMTNEVVYRNIKTGVNRLLPEGMGEKIGGFERVEQFTPPELQPAVQAQTEQQELTGFPVKDAVDVLEARLKDPDGLSNEEYEQFDRLVKSLVDGYDFAYESESKTDSTDSPSLIQIVNHLEGKIDGDSRISETGKKQFKKHLSDLLDGLPVITEEQSKMFDSVDTSAT